jgi:hypothetical protein
MTDPARKGCRACSSCRTGCPARRRLAAAGPLGPTPSPGAGPAPQAARALGGLALGASAPHRRPAARRAGARGPGAAVAAGRLWGVRAALAVAGAGSTGRRSAGAEPARGLGEAELAAWQARTRPTHVYLQSRDELVRWLRCGARSPRARFSSSAPSRCPRARTCRLAAARPVGEVPPQVQRHAWHRAQRTAAAWCEEGTEWSEGLALVVGHWLRTGEGLAFPEDTAAAARDRRDAVPSRLLLSAQRAQQLSDEIDSVCRSRAAGAVAGSTGHSRPRPCRVARPGTGGCAFSCSAAWACIACRGSSFRPAQRTCPSVCAASWGLHERAPCWQCAASRCPSRACGRSPTCPSTCVPARSAP